MNYCTKCGAKVKPGARFCTRCGAPLVQKPLAKPKTPSIAQPQTEPSTEPVAEPATEPTVEPATQPLTESVIKSVQEDSESAQENPQPVDEQTEANIPPVVLPSEEQPESDDSTPADSAQDQPVSVEPSPDQPTNDSSTSDQSTARKKKTGKIIAWSIIAIIVVIACVFGGIFAYQHFTPSQSASKKRAHHQAQPAVKLSDTVVIYDSESAADDGVNTNSPADKQSSKSQKRSQGAQKFNKSGKAQQHSSSTQHSRKRGHILSVSENTLRVSAPEKPRVGQIIAASISKTAPQGVLRKVTKVTPVSEATNQYTLDTRHAALTEAVESAHVTNKITLPVTGDQISAMPAQDTYKELNLASHVPHQTAFGGSSDFAVNPPGDLSDVADTSPGMGMNGFGNQDFAHLQNTMHNDLSFSSAKPAQKYNCDITADGQHQVAVALGVKKGKVDLTMTDHVTARVHDSYASLCPTLTTVGYYFHKPLTMMVGELPITVTPELMMTSFQALYQAKNNNVLTDPNYGGADANLDMTIDHTIGARYQTGKPLQAINRDHSELGKSTYAYDLTSSKSEGLGGVGSSPAGYRSHANIRANEYAAFLSNFTVNGFIAKTGVIAAQKTAGAFQKIPAREDASKAFTLPGIDGKLRGYLTPRGQIITSVAAGTTNALATLDQSQPISVQNIQEDTHDLTGKKMSFGTVDDRDQLTKPKYVAGTVGQFSSQLSIYADGTFMADADQSKVGEKDVTGIATVSGHFSFPNGVKKNQPFALHLDRLEYGNKPDSQQTIDSLEDGMQFTTYIYGLYDDDNHRPDLSKDLISDYMFYPAGTDQSALLPGMEGVADRVGLTNGKTAKSIIVGVRNGRAIKGYFVGNNPEE